MSSPELLALNDALVRYAVHERNSNTPFTQVFFTMKDTAWKAVAKVYNDE
jgi:hypothetical protein